MAIVIPSEGMACVRVSTKLARMTTLSIETAASSPPVTVGSSFERRELPTLSGAVLSIPDPHRLVHLQLRRFAGCPICSLHLREFTRRHEELLAAGVLEVAVFHSSATELRKAQTGLPFAVVPDPDRSLYAELGVGSSPRAVLHPRAWLAAARALASRASADPSAGAKDGSLGVPGDFLITPGGRIAAMQIGRHADDGWSVDEVLAHASEAGRR